MTLRTSGLIFLLLFAGSGVFAQTAYYDKMNHELRDFPIKTTFCKKTIQAPVIDGNINDACWKEAFVLKDFDLTQGAHRLGNITYQLGNKAKIQTTARVLYDDRFLYIAFECLEPDMEGIRSETVKHDDENINFDDRIEIFLDPEHDHQNILNFKVNVNGVTFEQPYQRPIQYGWTYVTGDIKWNTEWRARTQKFKDKWIGEIAIALDGVFKMPVVEGFTCGLNVCRDRHSKKYFKKINKIKFPQEYSAWSYVYNPRGATSDNWYEPNMYGDLIFGDESIAVEKLSFNESFATYTGEIWNLPQRWGDNPLKVSILNLKQNPLNLLFEVETDGYDKKQTFQSKQVIQSSASEEFDLRIPIRADGSQAFTLSIRDGESGQLLYNTSYTTRIPPFVEFYLEAVYAPSHKVSGYIQYIPVTTPDALKNHSLSMELRKNGEEKLLAKEIVENPGTITDFTDCFTNLDIPQLQSGDYYILCHVLNSAGIIEAEFKQTFTRRTYSEKRNFGAFEREYSFGGVSGKAIIVEFLDQKDFVFWEHAGYAPWWDSHNLGVCYQFVECWGYGNMGCCEPLQDRENRYSKVEIIENNPVRVVIRWTYALNSANYNIFLDEWADEYYTIYPDGTGIRSIHLWANSSIMHEILQPQYIFSPGVIPEQMFEDNVTEVFNLEGDYQFDELHLPASQRPQYSKQRDWKEGIMRMKLKDRSQPYMIWSSRKDLMPNIDDIFLTWQYPNSDVRYNLGAHWPVTDVPVDLYNIVATDKPYHSWSGWIHVISDKERQPNIWTHLFGSTTDDNEHLKDIATSWLYPANVEIIEGEFDFVKYDAAQKAYIFESQGKSKIAECRLMLIPEKREKVVNPVLVFKNCEREENIVVILNNQKLLPGSYKNAFVKNGESNDLLVWMNKTINKSDNITVLSERSTFND